jgi:rod shape-determining protein MreD
MIRRTVALAVLLLTVALLQVTVLPLLLRTGFVADLVVIVVVLVTLEEGGSIGLRVAAAGGILVDLLAASVPLGSTMVVYAIICVAVNLVRPYLSERAELATALIAGSAAGASVMIAGGLQTLLSEQGALPAGLVTSGALVVAALGVLVTPPMTVLVRRSLGDASSDRAADMSS